MPCKVNLARAGSVRGVGCSAALRRGRLYLLENSNIASFDLPGSTFTQAWDINPAGETVSVYRDGTGKFRGFLMSDGDFAIDFPGAIATVAFGMNPGGDIVGLYIDSSGKTHGFLLSRTQEHER